MQSVDLPLYVGLAGQVWMQPRLFVSITTSIASQKISMERQPDFSSPFLHLFSTSRRGQGSSTFVKGKFRQHGRTTWTELHDDLLRRKLRALMDTIRAEWKRKGIRVESWS